MDKQPERILIPNIEELTPGQRAILAQQLEVKATEQLGEPGLKVPHRPVEGKLAPSESVAKTAETISDGHVESSVVLAEQKPTSVETKLLQHLIDGGDPEELTAMLMKLKN